MRVGFSKQEHCCDFGNAQRAVGVRETHLPSPTSFVTWIVAGKALILAQEAPGAPGCNIQSRASHRHSVSRFSALSQEQQHVIFAI